MSASSFEPGMDRLKRLLIFCLLVLTYRAEAQFDLKSVDDLFTEEVVVDLREPNYVDGVLSTDQGGVITSPSIRVQAQKITYTRKTVDGVPVFQIEAESNLMIEHGERIFTGEHLEYDFIEEEGSVRNGKFFSEPWFVGGDIIELHADGSTDVINGVITTSEREEKDWQVQAETIRILSDNLLKASNVRFRFVKLPVFWLPSFKTNLNTFFKAPIKYRFRFSGKRGPRIGLSYQFLEWRDWRARLLLDLSFRRGLGGGFETTYTRPSGAEIRTVNYVARDISISDPDQGTRYRFQGSYAELFNDGLVDLEVTYDKLSDRDMATDYYEQGIDFERAERTQLSVRTQWPYGYARFVSRFRINGFQTVKQQLPTLAFSVQPLPAGESGIVFDSRFKAEYLDFQYANSVTGAKDFDAVRLFAQPRCYRSFDIGVVRATPELGFTGIWYSETPKMGEEFVGVATFDVHVTTRLRKEYHRLRHHIEPYAHYRFASDPLSRGDEHYIFDIEDGWHRIHSFRTGFRTVVQAPGRMPAAPRLTTDLYAHTFLCTNKLEHAVPRVHFDVTWNATSQISHEFESAWDTARGEIAHFNVRTGWTINEDIATSVEFRHRNAYTWRKLDPENFMLDMFRSEVTLRNSDLSDRRNTLLWRLFWRFHPRWIMELNNRSGWLRSDDGDYNEFQVNLSTRLKSAVDCKFSYQHRETEDRFTVAINLASRGRPKEKKTKLPIGSQNYY